MSELESPPSNSFATLVAEHHRAYTVALRVVGSPDAAEEVVQETYLKLIRNPPKCDCREQALIYLLQAVRHTALDFIKTEKNRKRREAGRVPEVNPEASAEVQASRKELALLARSALGNLPIEQREAISLCYEVGLTHRHAAEVLGIPERTASDRVQRGLAEIQRVLSRSGYASAIPLIGEGLRHLGGVQTPDSLAETLATMARNYSSKRLSIRRAKAVRRRVRPAASGSKLLMISGLAVASIAGFAMAMTRSNRPSAPLLAPASPLKPPQTSSRPLFSRTWSFKNGPPTDLQKTTGDWMWVQQDSAMLCGKNAGILLPVIPEPHGALLLRAVVTVRTRGLRALGVGWADEGGVQEHSAAITDSSNNRTAFGKDYTIDCWCIGSRVFIYQSGMLGAMLQFPPDRPRSRLILQITDYAINSLSLTETPIESVPADVRRETANFKAPQNWTQADVPFVKF